MNLNREMGHSSYGTHITPLVTAVMNTKGPVFEMGCGDFSTPLLHSICKAQSRELLSTDTSKEWLEHFRDLECGFHKFVYVPVYEDDWELNPKHERWDDIGNQHWSVVFVDHRPGERRRIDVERFKDTAEIIVVHDTETPSYDFEGVFSQFKYRYDYMRYNRYTTLVSNFIDISALF